MVYETELRMFDSFQEYHFDGERSITGIMPKIVILEDSGSTPGVHTTIFRKARIIGIAPPC